MNPQTGFWGKLPTHGDFVGRGLPDGFRARWDRWAARHLARRRGWPSEGLRLRIAGDGRAAAGLVLPSVDAVGRRFPLALFLIADILPGPEALDRWCDAALHALDAPDPETLWLCLDTLPEPEGPPGDDTPLLLWRKGVPPLAANPADPQEALDQLFSSG